MFELAISGTTLRNRTRPWNMRVLPLDGALPREGSHEWKKFIIDLKNRIKQLEKEKAEFDNWRSGKSNGVRASDEEEWDGNDSRDTGERDHGRHDLETQLIDIKNQLASATSDNIEKGTEIESLRLNLEQQLDEAKTVENFISELKKEAQEKEEHNLILIETKDKHIAELQEKEEHNLILKETQDKQLAELQEALNEKNLLIESKDKHIVELCAQIEKVMSETQDNAKEEILFKPLVETTDKNTQTNFEPEQLKSEPPGSSLADVYTQTSFPTEDGKSEGTSKKSGKKSDKSKRGSKRSSLASFAASDEASKIDGVSDKGEEADPESNDLLEEQSRSSTVMRKKSKKKKVPKAETVAALKLQTQMRRLASLREIEERREQVEREKQEEAAAKLQAMARRNEVLRVKEEAKRKEEEIKRKAEEARKLAEAQKAEKDNQDVTKVQSLARRRLSVQLASKLRALRFQEAANLIQRIARGFFARRIVSEVRREINAACKIQGLHRMRKAAVSVFLRRKELLRERRLERELASADHFQKMYMHGRKAPSSLRQHNCECCLCKAKELKRKERIAITQRMARFTKAADTKAASRRLQPISPSKISTRKGVNLHTTHKEETVHWIQRQSKGMLWTRGTETPAKTKKFLKRTLSFP